MTKRCNGWWKNKAAETIGAVDVQRAYLAAAQEKFTGLSDETDLVLNEWESVLNRLASDPLGLSDTLDWSAKRALLDEFREAEGLAWDDPTLQSLDLEYHNVDPDAGLYLGLEQEGRVRRVVTEEDIVRAVSVPPAGSVRAMVRGLAVSKFGGAVKSATWSRLQLADESGQIITLNLSLVQNANANEAAARLRDAQTVGAFVKVVQALEQTVENGNGAETPAPAFAVS